MLGGAFDMFRMFFGLSGCNRPDECALHRGKHLERLFSRLHRLRIDLHREYFSVQYCLYL